MENKFEIPVWKKITLSFEEAAAYSGIGINKLRFLADQVPELTVHIGNHTRIRRKTLEEYLNKHNDL